MSFVKRIYLCSKQPNQDRTFLSSQKVSSCPSSFFFKAPFFFKDCHLNFIYLFICLFVCLAALGLRCCARAFSSCGEQGLFLVAMRGLLIAVASFAAEHRLQVCGLQQLWHMASVVVFHGLQSAGSVVVAQRLSCSAACGIFPDQGLNQGPIHWQVDS